MDNSKVVEKLEEDIWTNMGCGTILLIPGLIAIAIVIGYVGNSPMTNEVARAFIGPLVFIVLGVCCFVWAGMNSSELKEFKKYVAVISNDPSGYIPNIAATLGTSENVVKSNLEIMIQKGYFESAFIDENSNCIVFANIQTTQTAPTSTNVSAKVPKVPGVEMVTVKCSGCGGINTIVKGQTGECDYCGSAIMGDYWNKGTYSSNRVS